ncbi:MAG: hypothetical protein HRU09_12615 [Oligoflexales bacterium]|nr:hypothetical protein [Oligoflexales bacterium]
MDPLAHILALISKKLSGQPASLMPESLVRALVELEEEGHRELAGFSNMLSDESLMELMDDNEPKYENDDS